MKTIGLLGGMSWESTVPYYRIINETVRERRGGLHSARLVLYSVDFAEIEPFLRHGDWERVAQELARGARALRAAGADGLVLATNTMHRCADELEREIGLPLLHIADATAEAVRAQGIGTVALLGTRYVMEQEFYSGRLRDRHGLTVMIPDAEERQVIHRVIFEELCRGRVLPESRAAFRAILGRLAAAGAEGIIFGCTEISLLVGPEDAPVPVFDTTELHARQAALWALGEAPPPRERAAD